MGDERPRSTGERISRAALAGLTAGLRTIWFLLRIVVPITLAVSLLDWLGALSVAARWLSPLMRFVGLPGGAALVFITSAFLNIYSAIAVALSMTLNMREATLLALMCLVAHNMVVETAVMRKTGSTAPKMALLRIGTALVAAFLLDLSLPAALAALPFSTGTAGGHLALSAMLAAWGLSTAKLVLKIVLIVLTIMVLQRQLQEFKVMELLSRALAPFMRLLGLPRQASFLWIVVNTVGYAYGAGIIESEVRSGHMEKGEADLFNHHAGICHSLLEDTALYLAVGVPLLWITVPRLVLAVAVVWLERGRRRLRRKGGHLRPSLPLPRAEVDHPHQDGGGRGQGGGEADPKEPG